MHDSKFQNSYSSQIEFVLSGRRWFLALSVVICAAAADFLINAPEANFPLSGWEWNAVSISNRAHQNVLAFVCMFIAIFLFIWIFIGPYLARKLIITDTSVVLCKSPIFSGNRVTMPFSEISETGFNNPSPYYRKNDIAIRINKRFSFKFNGRFFGFNRFMFSEEKEFDKFCDLIIQRANSQFR